MPWFEEIADALVTMIEQHTGGHQRAADVVESDAAMGIPGTMRLISTIPGYVA